MKTGRGSTTQPPAFTLGSAPYGDSRKQVAIFACTSCSFTGEFPAVKHTHAFNADAVVRKAEEAGWQIKGLRVTCPLCIQKRARAAKGESPGPKFVPSTILPAQPATVPEDPPVSEAKPARLSLASAMDTVAAASKAPVLQPPALSPAQKSAARQLLDRHFEDGQGRYLGGWNDQKVADELKVPRASLEVFRENAYGPLKPLPELALAEDALKGLDGEVAKATEARDILKAEADAAIKALGDAIRSAQERVAAARRALGLV